MKNILRGENRVYITASIFYFYFLFHLYWKLHGVVIGKVVGVSAPKANERQRNMFALALNVNFFQSLISFATTIALV